MKNTDEMNPHRIAQYLNKPPEEFTREDLIKFMAGNDIQAVNFRHIGGDGRLKTLNFIINSKEQLDRLLATGERVDGSNLFSYIHSTSSDLYIVPRYRTAYVNPFSIIPTVDILCSYYTHDGESLKSSPENVVRRAHEALKNTTGLSLQAMGELEYYIVYDKETLYQVAGERGYEESYPFAKQEQLRCEAMQVISQTGGMIKYGHSEAGFAPGQAQDMEQNEIEFALRDVEDAADQIVLARWILRTLAYKHGVNITFAPMISVGHAGNGLHIHSRVMQDGRNVLVDENRLSTVAKKVIAGYLSLARSLTAFGNSIPLSYARISAQKESPNMIYWSDRNRLALVRIPLGWLGVGNMIKDANPQETRVSPATTDQTVEFRSPDGSASIHLLLAGMAVAARHGLEMENALEIADRLYMSADSSPQSAEGFAQLPSSCWESAECLLEQRETYEKDDVFPGQLINGLATRLESYGDKDIGPEYYSKEEEVKKSVSMYFHCA